MKIGILAFQGDFLLHQKILEKIIGRKNYAYFNLIKYNKKKFSNLNNNSNGKILIEYNTFQSYHIPVAYFSNYLKKTLNAEIFAFFNYSIIFCLNVIYLCISRSV